MLTAHKLKAPAPHRTNTNLRTISCCIIVDPLAGPGRTPEEEVEQLKREFSEAFENPIRFYRAMTARPGAGGIEPGTDIVLFDFGGMFMGNDLMGENSRKLLRWLEDNPNSLGIITSSFTWQNGIENELRDLGFQTDAERRWDRLTRDEGEQERPLFHNVINWCARWDSERGEKPVLYTLLPDWFDATMAGIEKSTNEEIKAKGGG
jgi:hypothetical protein